MPDTEKIMDKPALDFAIIDAHQHFWDPVKNYHPWLRDKPPVPFRYGDYQAICRPYLPADYLADTSSFRIAGTVYIEAEWDPRDPGGEMRYIEQLRSDTGFPSVAVAHTRLDSPHAQAMLEQQAAYGFVRGIRHKPAANATPSATTPGGMTQSAWRAGFALLARYGLRFDLQTPWWHLHEAAGLANDFPETQIILNHTGLPSDRSAQGLAGWRDAMSALARCPNVAVKTSGIGVPGQRWTVEDNRWIVLTTIDLFGAERCLFGSNFPVDSLCGTFDEIAGGLSTIVQDFPATEKQKLFHDNAARIYAFTDYARSSSSI